MGPVQNVKDNRGETLLALRGSITRFLLGICRCNTARPMAEPSSTDEIHDLPETPLKPEASLVRTIGRWSLVALMVNTMVGASIFGLPALIAARLGPWSPVGFLAAFAVIALIAACMAEVASQFQDTGGPYLYTRVTFGRLIAIQNSWLTWLTRIAAASSVANLFIIYLAEFFPAITKPSLRASVLTALIGFLALVNY